jgi:hypothetical protein
MTTTSTAIVVYDPELAGPEHIALAGFLGGYRGLTRDAYALDLRQFVAFCDERHWACSRSGEATSRPTDGSWKLGVGQRPPSVGDCAP